MNAVPAHCKVEQPGCQAGVAAGRPCGSLGFGSVWVIRKLLPLESARGMLTFSCNASILEGGEKRIRSSHHPWLNIEFKASPGYNETLLKNQTKANKPQLLTMFHELKDHLDRSVPSFPVAFFSTLPSMCLSSK